MTSAEPPRRLSIHDASYDHAIGNRLEVLFAGVALTNVVSYDVDGRTLTRHATDEHGNVILDRQADAIKLETLTGDVAVRWRNPD